MVVCVLAVTLLGSNAEDQFTQIPGGTDLSDVSLPEGSGAAVYTGIEDLSVGDCIEADVAAGTAEATDVAPISCDEPHRSEVSDVVDLPDGEFPGDAAIQQTVEEACYTDAYRDYVGVDVSRSRLAASAVWPLQGSWDGGHRTVVCFVHNIDPSVPSTGSLRGSGL